MRAGIQVLSLHFYPVLVAVLSTAGVSSASDWPRLGGPGGSYVSPETGLARAWPTNGPRVLWSVAVGRGYAGAAIWDRQVYFLDRPDSERDLLRCLDLDTGRERWAWACRAPGRLPYPGSRNIPTVEDRFIFVLSPFGPFTCLNRRTHHKVWTKHMVNDFKDRETDVDRPAANRAEQLARVQVPMWGLTQAPLLWGDTVIVAPQSRKVGLVAYEKTTGTVRWQSGYIGRNWYSHVSPTLAVLCGVPQVIMLAQPSDPEKAPSQAPPAIISSVDPASGRILWTTQTPGPHKIIVPQPLPLEPDRLFITGGYGMGCIMLQVQHTNNNWSTRLLFHNKNVAAHIHSPVLYQDHIYVSSFREHGGTHTGLVCLNRDGLPLWQTGPKLQFHDGSMLMADGMALVMGGKSGILHLMELSSSGSRMLATAKLLPGRQLWAPMALSHGKLIVRDQETMVCLDLTQEGMD